MIPRARVLSTGSEILQGLYADTNARDLSRVLLEQGIRVVGHAAAPDIHEELRRALEYSTQGCELVVITGGLGPTEDDLTRHAVSEIWNLPLDHFPIAERMMRRRFKNRNYEMPERNLIQAKLPRGCVPLYNHWGTAPGFALQPMNSLPALIALPGPPNEWKQMLDRAFASVLSKLFPDRVHSALHNIIVGGMPESALNERLRGLFYSEDDQCDLTILANRGFLRLRLLAFGDTTDIAETRLKAFREKVLTRFNNQLIAFEGTGEPNLSVAIFELLRKRNATLALAESCTGGMIASAITDIAGSSEVFLAGWITYTNEAKARDLGVPAYLIEEHGAVSSEVVEAMARGALEKSGADYALSVSGIAGPTGGTPEKPVGTVWIGIASRDRVASFHNRFPGDRESVRTWTLHTALEQLRRFVLELPADLPMGPTTP